MGFLALGVFILAGALIFSQPKSSSPLSDSTSCDGDRTSLPFMDCFNMTYGPVDFDISNCTTFLAQWSGLPPTVLQHQLCQSGWPSARAVGFSMKFSRCRVVNLKREEEQEQEPRPTREEKTAVAASQSTVAPDISWSPSANIQIKGHLSLGGGVVDRIEGEMQRNNIDSIPLIGGDITALPLFLRPGAGHLVTIPLYPMPLLDPNPYMGIITSEGEFSILPRTPQQWSDPSVSFHIVSSSASYAL